MEGYSWFFLLNDIGQFLFWLRWKTIVIMKSKHFIMIFFLPFHGNEVKSKTLHSLARQEVRWPWPSLPIFKQWTLCVKSANAEGSGRITGQEAEPNFDPFELKLVPSARDGLCLRGGTWKVMLPFFSLLRSELSGTSHLNFWKTSSAWRTSPKLDLQSLTSWFPGRTALKT